MADWVYPDSFFIMVTVANWVAVASTICCVYLLVSWAALPVDKTNRHYLSVCLTFGVLLMTLGFVVPLVTQPNQCYDSITPHSMSTSKVCGASGSLLILGGWSGVMWAFLRSLSLHLQICWQVLVGRNFMFFAQAIGWGIPLVGITVALVFSGVSFRFGPTCHINHKNSLADLWIPLLIVAGATVILTFATFGCCVKVYLASLYDSSETTDRSSLPAHTSSSIQAVSPRQAYRRVRRVIALQWRGIALVLIIIADVIFFSVIFVFQDDIVQSVRIDPQVSEQWVLCLIGAAGDKNACLDYASSLALNGIWLLFLLGRISMLVGWYELFRSMLLREGGQREFVSVDAIYEDQKNPRSRSYEMLSRGSSTVVTPLSPVKFPAPGPSTPDYFGKTARYHTPANSFSSPRPPQQGAHRKLSTDSDGSDIRIRTA
ncbi:uncharacterized protein CPUR_05216 [Claviceps purpurea 20.1]|uniref:G-protein coupled receptors family 2 profile 2 domain-containing protein n=1 Tax=Claviceps purpurea (strain 20.1) TaxID=1111077 RepID=M1WFZ3_CLAP2|nr:hypothetical protein E4U38_005554 [Claviceps purpurea]CCE31364.1 uncharacterized protein CPUR_05216 [Claviceps purpurea 20.1]